MINKDVTKGQASVTLSKTPLTWIKKSIGETGDPYGIPVSISFPLFSCRSIQAESFDQSKRSLSTKPDPHQFKTRLCV